MTGSLRILTYSLAASPSAVVWLQSLDDIGAGIYGVAVAVAIGGVVGPALSGVLVERLGFRALGAMVFSLRAAARWEAAISPGAALLSK